MRVWVGGAAAAGLLLVAGLAQAQDAVRSYRFKTPLGDEVRCTIYREGGRERQEVLQTFYNGSFVLDRDATQASWAASGCMQHVANQSRPVSAEEQQRRFDEIRRGPRYEGPGGLREQIVDLMCSDPKNAGSEECRRRGAR